MESKGLKKKLIRWAFILQEYDFNIMHRVGRVNWDVDGLNQNPSSSQEDTTKVRWHGDVDLEAIPNGMLMHTCVPYYNVLGMYLKQDWVVRIPKRRILNQRATWCHEYT